jgi:hypothetical protein
VSGAEIGLTSWTLYWILHSIRVGMRGSKLALNKLINDIKEKPLYHLEDGKTVLREDFWVVM